MVLCVIWQRLTLFVPADDGLAQKLGRLVSQNAQSKGRAAPGAKIRCVLHMTISCADIDYPIATRLRWRCAPGITHIQEHGQIESEKWELFQPRAKEVPHFIVVARLKHDAAGSHQTDPSRTAGRADASSHIRRLWKAGSTSICSVFFISVVYPRFDKQRMLNICARSALANRRSQSRFLSA